MHLCRLWVCLPLTLGVTCHPSEFRFLHFLCSLGCEIRSLCEKMVGGEPEEQGFGGGELFWHTRTKLTACMHTYCHHACFLHAEWEGPSLCHHAYTVICILTQHVNNDINVFTAYWEVWSLCKKHLSSTYCVLLLSVVTPFSSPLGCPSLSCPLGFTVYFISIREDICTSMYFEHREGTCAVR